MHGPSNASDATGAPNWNFCHSFLSPGKTLRLVVLAGHKSQPTSDIQAVCVRCPAIINVGDPGQAKKDSNEKKAQVKGVGDNWITNDNQSLQNPSNAAITAT